MGKKYIHILIDEFCKNEQSLETQHKFQVWFLNAHSKAEKEGAMYRLWEEDKTTANDSTYYNLYKLNQQIKKSNTKQQKRIGLYLQRIAVILLLPLLGAVSSYYYLMNIAPIKQETQLHECFASNGEHKKITLPDGTRVWINSGSLLVYDKHFNGKERVLFLNGEALFHVAKDPERPFLVKTANMTVKALGTVFNLNAYTNQETTTVTLKEGKIQVAPYFKDDTSFILIPNEQIIYNYKKESILHSQVNAQRVLQWVDGYLIFEKASFDQISKTIERKFNVSIYYETERFAGRSFTLKFKPQENLIEVLDILQEMISGFHYKIKEDKIYIN